MSRSHEYFINSEKEPLIKVINRIEDILHPVSSIPHLNKFRLDGFFVKTGTNIFSSNQLYPILSIPNPVHASTYQETVGYVSYITHGQIPAKRQDYHDSSVMYTLPRRLFFTISPTHNNYYDPVIIQKDYQSIKVFWKGLDTPVNTITEHGLTDEAHEPSHIFKWKAAAIVEPPENPLANGQTIFQVLTRTGLHRYSPNKLLRSLSHFH